MGTSRVLLLALAIRKRPQLDGSLTVEREGRVLQELMLTGSTRSLAPVGAQDGPTGTVSAMTGKTPHVIVKAQVGGEKIRARLTDGQRVEVGGYTLIYTAKHTRVLEMIG